MEIKKQHKPYFSLRAVIWFLNAQAWLIAILCIYALVSVSTTGKELLIKPDGWSRGYYSELDESKEAAQFAKQVEREITKGLKK
jgi:hypothetical protein